jgi:hypothetical protein
VVAAGAAVAEEEEVHTRGAGVRSSSADAGAAGDFPVVVVAAAKIDKDHPAAFEHHAIVLVPVAAVADLLDLSSSLSCESCYFRYHPTTAAAAVGKTAAAVVLVHYQL